MQIPESIHALIASAPQAHLTTLNANGSPQVTLVWVGIESNYITLTLALSLRRRGEKNGGTLAAVQLCTDEY